jgi:2-polyprenyl-3-methyl-5-hydroxy-6-metoxy-1,4-benzoquinol methylase
MFDVRFLNQLRSSEKESVLPAITGARRILEFGAGTGEQAKTLSELGFDVVAIDLSASQL